MREAIEDGSFAKRVMERLDKMEDQKRRIIEKYFPEHVGHKMTEGEWKYFDAMFVSFDLICDCGATLTITREMVESVK